MARKRRTASLQSNPTDPLKRLADLVALLLVKGERQPEKIRTLTAAGYTAAEVATLLGTTPNLVSVTLYQMRKKKKLIS